MLEDWAEEFQNIDNREVLQVAQSNTSNTYDLGLMG